MSEENVEIVRRIYEEKLIDRDQDGLLDLATPDVQYINPPEAADPGIRRGRTDVGQAFRSFSEHFDASQNELRELFDCGDAVVASVHFRTRSRGSQKEVVQEEAHTWTLRGGKTARFEWGRDLQTALDAAGLSE